MPVFPERLKELRKAKGITQKAMAKFLNIAEQAYQRYEYGEREPNHETTIKIADYFGVSIDYLLGRTNYWLDANGHMVSKMLPNDSADSNTESSIVD